VKTTEGLISNRPPLRIRLGIVQREVNLQVVIVRAAKLLRELGLLRRRLLYGRQFRRLYRDGAPSL